MGDAVPRARERRRAHRQRHRAGRGPLPRDHRARPEDPRRGDRRPAGAAASDGRRRRRRVQALRHLRLPARPHARSSRRSAGSRSTSAGLRQGARGAARAQRRARRSARRPSSTCGARCSTPSRPSAPAGVKFIGYEREEGEGQRRRDRRRAAQLVDRAIEGDEVAIVVTDVTPFYGESGGQVGDAGVIERRGGADALRGRATRRSRSPGSSCTTGKVAEGDARRRATRCTLAVDHDAPHARRGATTRRRTSCTGRSAPCSASRRTQKGSLVGPDRLRFDFAHGKALTPEEIAAHRGPGEREGAHRRARHDRGAPDRRGARSAARWRSSRRSTATSCACSR